MMIRDGKNMSQLFKLPRLSLGKKNDYAIMFDPESRYHGWLFVKNPEDKWVSVHKLQIIDNPSTTTFLFSPVTTRSEED